MLETWAGPLVSPKTRLFYTLNERGIYETKNDGG